MMNTALLETTATSFREQMSSRALPLLAYWYTSRGDNPVPDRTMFNPYALREWLGFISIYQYDPVRGDFKNRLEGTLITEMTGQDWTGRWASDVDQSFGSTFLEELAEVHSTATPTIDSVRIYQKKYRTATKLLMPVAENRQRGADQVFLAMFPNW
ncbi:MAG: PAS domain-containing protein [Nisaea sp.]|uniref:PAS domain-containing protein n=1 Tax=Nisaea sp. TaxID=2024842 RepID=UPI001B23F7F9|nr:PAS domain-containing protein [Nisaea sp.]MBO6559410.1 PAS domain-containing protein [Nisaea sp.]